MSIISRERAIELIRKLQVGGETEEDENIWAYEIKSKVLFGGCIINTIFWSDEDLTPEEIYEKCEKEYKPIIL